MFHIVCFLVVERLLYLIIYIFYTMIVILAIFGILIFFLLHKSNHMLRKGPWECKNMHPGSWNNNKHEYARQLATGPPCGPAQRVFSKDYFNTRQPQLPRIWPNGRCNASLGVESLSQCERPPLAWSRLGETTTRVGARHHMGPKLVPKFAQMCNIIHPLVINNQEYNFMTSNDSPSVTMTGFYVYWEYFFCVPW